MVFIVLLLPTNNLNSSEASIDDFGIISIMYHRFEENKYPSTNIKMNDFLKHLEMIQEEKIEFVNPKSFLMDLRNKRKQENYSSP